MHLIDGLLTWRISNLSSPVVVSGISVSILGEFFMQDRMQIRSLSRLFGIDSVNAFRDPSINETVGKYFGRSLYILEAVTGDYIDVICQTVGETVLGNSNRS